MQGREEPVVVAFASIIEREEEPDDDVLMARCGAGDRAAFEVLYQRHRAPLYRFLLRMCRRRSEADEAFQDVWLAVLRGARQYAGRKRFAAWLFTLARRRAIDRARLAFRRAAAEADIATLHPQPAHDAAFEAADLGRALLAAVEALPPPQREAFLMQAEGGLSLEEIAAATGVGRETAKSRLRYAHRRLREVLESSR